MPSAPDWQKNPTRPGGGRCGASDALSDTFASRFTTPSALGPTTRMPFARASVTSSRWAASPVGPFSPKPEVMTTSARTPFDRQASNTPGTSSGGTASTARSTSSGMSVTDG